MKSKLFSTRKRREGWSLLEIIVGLAISMGVILVLTQFVGIISNIQGFLDRKLRPQQDVESTLQSMVTEVRSMGPSAAGAYPLESAGTSTIVFYSDINQNGTFERVRYTIATNTLQKGVTVPVGNPPTYPTSTGEVVTVVVPNTIASSSSFAYFDTNYTGTQPAISFPITDPTIVRSVQIILTADVSTSTSPKPTTFTDFVTIRNLRSN